jgi:hypothetical protein
MAEMLEGSKNMTNNIANAGVDMYNNTTSAASSALSSGMTSVTDSVEVVKDFGEKYINNFSTVFFALIALIIISALVGYGLYFLIIENIGQQRIVVDGTEIPIICNENKEFKIIQSLDTAKGNGKRITYMFWIYINDITKFAGEQYRHIAHIGKDNKSIYDSSPYIIMDKISNKIYVRFAPSSDDATIKDKLLNTFTENDIKTKFRKYDSNTKECGFEIPYIPVQRWVHVAFSVNDSRKGSIYVYIDAELIKIYESKSDFNLDITELNLQYKGGNLYTGGNVNETLIGLTGFSGLISKFTMYNNDLNQNDIYKEYNQGPFSGLLTRIGLNQYGIRNPIYKITDE